MNNIDPIQNNSSPTDDKSQNSHTDINNNINNSPINNHKHSKKFSKYARLSESQKLIIKSKVDSNIPVSQIAREESVCPQTIYNVVNKADYPVLENKQLDKLQKSIISSLHRKVERMIIKTCNYYIAIATILKHQLMGLITQKKMDALMITVN